MSTTDDRAELKPCPFCESPAKILQRGRKYFSTVYACTKCDCRLATDETKNYGKVWNTRAADAGVREALDRVVKFDDCETAEPRLRDMVLSYYRMGLNPDHALAKKCAERFIAALTTPAQSPADTTEGE